jgi:hypothetical protein
VGRVETVGGGERRDVCRVYLGNLRQRGHWEDPDVDGRTTVKWRFKKQDGGLGVD